MAWLDAATASDSVTYKPEVGEVAGSSPTSRSVLFLLFILSSIFFNLCLSLRQAAFVNFYFFVSRAVGKYFFFCSKKRDDKTVCRFARPAEDELAEGTEIKKRAENRLTKTEKSADTDGKDEKDGADKKEKEEDDEGGEKEDTEKDEAEEEQEQEEE